MDDILKCPLCGGVKFQDQGNSGKCLYCGASIEKPKQNKVQEIVTPIAGNNPQWQNITVIVNSPNPQDERRIEKLMNGLWRIGKMREWVVWLLLQLR